MRGASPAWAGGAAGGLPVQQWGLQRIIAGLAAVVFVTLTSYRAYSDGSHRCGWGKWEGSWAFGPLALAAPYEPGPTALGQPLSGGLLHEH